jgi:hypothetical protein
MLAIQNNRICAALAVTSPSSLEPPKADIECHGTACLPPSVTRAWRRLPRGPGELSAGADLADRRLHSGGWSRQPRAPRPVDELA